MELQGKTALISGGGGGIGRAVALALARAGAKTAVADIAKPNAEKVRDEVQAFGTQAMACPVDLTKKPEVDRMVEEIVARFGQIDILVNCQGWDRLEPFVESTEETWEKLQSISFKSVLYTARAVRPRRPALYDFPRNRQGGEYKFRCRAGRFQLGSGVRRSQRRRYRVF